MRHRSTACALLLCLLAPGAWVQSPALAAVAESADSADSARVIVKFKADSPLLRKQALSVSAVSAVADQQAARAEALGQRLGMAAHRLRAGQGVSERMQVMTASGIGSAALAARLARESDIEYAVVDERRKRLAAPNDPLYLSGPAVNFSLGTGGPASGQWYLRTPDSVATSAINIEPAWDLLTAAGSVVVADLDTGVWFGHADLQGVASGGNFLAGYDFVTNDFVGNDGSPGRDSDPSDPGDWVTATDVRSAANNIGCTTADISNSSWHGTQTASLIAATTNNGIGMAGTGGTHVRLLPVRVLGKCGGFDSDIIAGMRWAAGISVPGVPNNPNPARVLNLSLGGTGACSQAYKDAISDVTGRGAVIVAAAGNTSGHAVGTPANCPGVIAVAGLRHAGTKSLFSDLGPEVAISAPAGNCVNTAVGSACLYPIISALNGGTTTPLAGSSLYTDSFKFFYGTSFSSPLVAGAVALMFAAQPTLQPSEVRTLLQQSARAFPTTGGDNGDGTVVPLCTAPQYDASGNAIDQSQCYCTTSTCGAGMLDAGAAVAAAASLLQARITASSDTPTAGQALSFSASNSVVASGRRLVSYAWSIVNGGGIVNGFSSSTNAATASVTPSAAGTFIVGVSVTDDRGATASAQQSVTVQPGTSTPTTPTLPATPTPTAPPAESGGGGGGAVGLQWLLLLLGAVLWLRRLSRTDPAA